MRFRVLRPLLLSALLAPGGSLSLGAEDPITRVTPVARVPFRKVALSRDMNLRETPLVSQPTTSAAPIHPSAPLSASTPLPALSKPAPVRLPTARLPAELNTAKPGAPTVAKTFLPLPIPSRSVLPSPSEAPLSSLPPGGRELALQPTTFTPYDRYLGSVRSVIYNLDLHPADMVLAAQLMKVGRRFKYCVCDPYRADPPALTAARRAGDCKSKALWLYDSLGDSNALFVIGKAQKRARTSHAWVYWRNDERWWILDCTERSEPIAADSVSSDLYVPYYSFGKGGAYRHKATRLILTGGAVAKPKPVAGIR